MSAPSLALVGCGAIAEAFYLPALQKRPDLLASLVLVDRNRDRAEALRAECGAGSVSTDHNEIIDRVDGAIIATPHHLHTPLTLEFVERGKHVLCEKPLAATVEDVDRVIAATAEHGVRVAVNHTRRLYSSMQEVQRVVSTGGIGELKEIDYVLGEEFGWPAETNTYFGVAAGGKGILFDIGAHILDLVCWLMGGKPDLVSCEDDARGGTEAVAKIVVRKGDAVARVHLSWLSDLSNSYRIVGSKGSIEGRAFEWSSYTKRTASGQKKTVKTDKARQFAHFADKLLANFVDVVEGKAEPTVSPSDVRPSVALITECYENRTSLSTPWYTAYERLTDV